MLGDPQNDLEHAQEPDVRQIFAEQSEFYWNQLSERCEANKPIAAIGVVNTSDSGDLLVFRYGSVYEQAKIVARVLKQLRAEIESELQG